MLSPGLTALARCAWNCFVVVLDIATPFLPAVWAVFPARTPPLLPLSSRCCCCSAAGPRASRSRPGPLGPARLCLVSSGRGAVTASVSIAFGLVSSPGV